MSAFGQPGGGTGFGQTQSSGSSLFGQPQQQTSTGIFGSSNPSNASGFGQQAQPASQPGLFGSKRSNSFSGTSNAQGSLFGNPGATSTTNSWGFGQNQNQNQGQLSASNTQPLAGGLFGSQQNGLFGQNKPAASSFGSTQTQMNGGQFGSSNMPTTQSTTGTGLFGAAQSKPAGSAQSKPAGPGLFGQTTAPQSTGLFGSSSQTQGPNTGGGGLFGQTATANSALNTSGSFGQTNPTSGGSGLFGKPATSGGLFGSAPTLNNAASTTTGGGLFGSKPPTTSLFNQAANTTNGNLQNGTSSSLGNTGLFGSQNNQQQQQRTGLFASQPSGAFQAQQPVQQQPQMLYASIDQAPYGFNVFAPKATTSSESITRDISGQNYADQKLYSSLLRSKSSSSSETAKGSHVEFNGNGDLMAQNQATLKLADGRGQSSKLYPAQANQLNARKWMNSYQDFLATRPTTLVIKRDKHSGNDNPKAQKSLLAIEDANNTTSAANGDISEYPHGDLANKSAAAESSHVLDQSNGIPIDQDVQDKSILPVGGDVSIFHRQANNVTLVRVNKRALEMGYFVRPPLEQLAAQSKQQLSAVNNLVIGREGVGQIEYSTPVDLSGIQNLGSILGGIVVFEPGTVDVYPDQSTRKPPGKELNLPCTVTIEQAWPRDPTTLESITNMADTRMARHIDRLRRSCESRGGEFLTFAHGVWVFKVPHFSMWGLPAEEMIIEDVEDVIFSDERPSSEIHDAAMETVNVQSVEFFRDGEQELDEVELLTNEGQAHPIAEGGQNVDEQSDMLSYPTSLESEPVEPEEASDWVTQLQHAANSVLAASQQTIEAASKPNLDLQEILFQTEAPGPTGQFSSHNPWIIKSKAKISGVVVRPPIGTRLQCDYLLARSERLDRARSKIPLLKTKLEFEELANLANNDIWALATILYGSRTREQLADWLEKRLEKRITEEAMAATSDFESIWILISGHKLEEAAARAVSCGCPHLAVLISLLGDENSRDDARKQLQDWTESNADQHIPRDILRIYELAGGAELAGYEDWERCIGMQLWYSKTSLKSALDSLKSDIAKKDGSTELAFIRAAVSPQQLSTALSFLPEAEAFICLLAVPQAPPELFDRLCHNLSLNLLDSGDSEAALVTALHINDRILASRVLRTITTKTIAGTRLAIDIPSTLRDEAMALHAHYHSKYDDEARYLLSAGEFDKAHQVLITHVAPIGVIHGALGSVKTLLGEVDISKTPDWSVGGQVYLDYISLCEKPSTMLTMKLCSTIGKVPHRSQESRVAISLMAQGIAEIQKQLSVDLSTNQILSLPLSSSQYHIQALNQAAALLK